MGRGVFARKRLRAGQVIGEVTGRIVCRLDPANDGYLDLGGGLALEAKPPFRFLNHGCTPNCEVVRDGPSAKGIGRPVPRLLIQAMRNIQPGVELRCDYGWPAESAIPCKCGSPKCRGWIVAANQLQDLNGFA